MRRRDEEEEAKVVFRGWARMALPLKAFSVVEVRKPNVGQAKPAAVTADAVLNTASAQLWTPLRTAAWKNPAASHDTA